MDEVRGARGRPISSNLSFEGESSGGSSSYEPLRKKLRPLHVGEGQGVGEDEVGVNVEEVERVGLMRLNVDSMGLILSFLEVNDAYRIVTFPLSR